MPFPWIAALQAMAAAASAYMDHLRNRESEQAREADRDLILAAIRTAEQNVLTELVRQRIAQLDGALEGFQTVYSSYDPDPDDPIEEERLRSLIDDAAGIIGELGKLIDQVRVGGVAADAALQSWPIYIQLLYLRAQAMTERQVTYGAEEIDDAVPSFETALDRAELLLSYLRSVSDGHFSEVVCRLHPDAQGVVCWYRFGTGTITCGRDIRRCNTSRQRHMDIAYAGFDGVGEITGSADDIRKAIAVLAALTIVERFRRITHGQTLPPVRVSREGQLEVDDDEGGQLDFDRIFAEVAPPDRERS